MFRRIAICLVAACTLVAPLKAQVTGQNAAPDTNPVATISVRSQLVTETVTVKNKDGNAVSNLTAQDFVLTEDGAPQKIRFCEHEVLPSRTEPLPAAPQSQEEVTVFKKLNRSQIAPEAPENRRYKGRRLLALYFDMSAMGAEEQIRALRAAESFVRTQMTPADLVSILRYTGGSVDVLQDFSADRNRLLSILETLAVGEGQEWATTTSDASSSDNGAAFGQDDGEFNVFNTDRQLSALQTTATMLGHLNEKKVLIYFAGGLNLNGIDNQAQLHATVDAAIRAGVSFWPVDARGLVAEAPLGDAKEGSPGNNAVYAGTAEQAVQSDSQASQDTLYALAGDTGGKALLDTNDLTRGIVQAQQSVSDYYILGYYATNSALDGRYRRIKIAVHTPEAVKVEYRQGYFAGKEFSHFTGADKERQLEDALMLDDPITDLSMAMEIDYFQLNRAEYFVPIIIKIPGRELVLAKHGGADHTLIDFVGEVKDVYGGTTVTNVRDHVNIKLTDATETQLARAPIEYDAGFTLLPGKYKIKILARDDETGRIGTYETLFTIPNLNKEEKGVPISSVILSDQRVDLKDAVYNAMKSKDQVKEVAANPLIENGSKLIPSVTRVFSRSRSLYIYLQGYEPDPVAPPKPLMAFVSLFQHNEKRLQTTAIAVSPGARSRLKIVPLSFTIDLSTLNPGEYECQISILDPSGGKSSFFREEIDVTP